MDRYALMLIGLIVTGCSSPESFRARGGGSGADLGNRGSEVLMHEGSKPYANTPTLQPATPPSLEPARQAHLLSIER